MPWSKLPTPDATGDEPDPARLPQLLDDVFSELDPERSDALLRSLPEGQTILSTASGLPPGVDPGAIVRVREGVASRG